MRTWLIPLLLVPVLALAACGGDEDDGAAAPPATDAETDESLDETTTSTVSEAPAFEESEADSVLEYRLVDFAFEGPRTARGPKLFFKAENVGSQEHELEVLDPGGEGLGEAEAMPPWANDDLAIELEPGTYTLQCILETPDGRIHKDLGMVAELVVE